MYSRRGFAALGTIMVERGNERHKITPAQRESGDRGHLVYDIEKAQAWRGPNQ